MKTETPYTPLSTPHETKAPSTITVDKTTSMWPERLNKLGDNIFNAIQIQGKTTLLKTNTLGFTGDRVTANNVEKITGDCITQAIDKNITIVSTTFEGTNNYAHKDALEKGGNTILIVTKEEHQDLTKTGALEKDVDWNRQLLVIIPPTVNNRVDQRVQQLAYQSHIHVGLSQAMIYTQGPSDGKTYLTAFQALETKTPLHAFQYDTKGSIPREFYTNSNLHDLGAEKLGMNPNTLQPNMTKVFGDIALQNAAENSRANGFGLEVNLNSERLLLNDNVHQYVTNQIEMKTDKVPQIAQQENTKPKEMEMER